MWIVGLVVIVGWIVSVCLHEFGHAVVAYWGGDLSVKDKGYLTLNPTKYIDPQMSLILPVFFLMIGGIALPGAAVYVNEAALRSRRWSSAVSAAGPFASAVSVLLLSILFWLFAPDSLGVDITPNGVAAGGSLSDGFWAALAFLIFLNVYMTFLNSLPIPPLDGFGVLRPWLPPSWQAQANRLGKYGILILFGLIWFVRPFGQFLSGMAFGIVASLGIPRTFLVAGFQNFQASATPILIAAIVVYVVYQNFLKPAHKRHWDKGQALLRRGQYEPALAQFDQAVALEPDWHEPHYGKGLALECLGRQSDALKAYDEAIAHHSDHLGAYQRRVAIHLQQGQRQAVLADYKAMAKLEPENLYHPAAVAFFSGRYGEAIAQYDAILATDPNNAVVWCNKACCYSHLNDIDNVVTHLQKAIDLDRNTLNMVKTDPDLAVVRDHPRVQALLMAKGLDSVET